MKKTYAAPAVLKSGHAVPATNGSGFPSNDETVGLIEGAGSVGFHL